MLTPPCVSARSDHTVTVCVGGLLSLVPFKVGEGKTSDGMTPDASDRSKPN